MTYPIRFAADSELAADCAAGREAACERLFRDYHGYVLNVCRRILKNREDAEDMTQNVFIHIFRKISLYRGESRLKTWIHRIAVNHCLMLIRKNSRLPFAETIEEKEFALPAPGSQNPRRPSIDHKILLEKCIPQLPAGMKKVFILYDVRGFNHEETARALNLSVGTVKSQLHKARKNLRRLINRKENPKISPRR